MSYAYLSLPSTGVTKKIVITDYSYSYTSALKTAQLREQNQYYPIRATVARIG